MRHVELQERDPEASGAPSVADAPSPAAPPRPPSGPSFAGRWIAWSLPRLAAAAYLVLLSLWIAEVKGGLSSEGAGALAWHALGQSLFVVALAEAALLPSTPPCAPGAPAAAKRFSAALRSAWLHAATTLVAFFGFALGRWGMVGYKPAAPGYAAAARFSPHAWIGLLFFALCAVQALAALAVAVGAPGARRSLSRFHRALGWSIVALGVGSCALGFQADQSIDLAYATASAADGNATAASVGPAYAPGSALSLYACFATLALAAWAAAAFFARR